MYFQTFYSMYVALQNISKPDTEKIQFYAH